MRALQQDLSQDWSCWRCNFLIDLLRW